MNTITRFGSTFGTDILDFMDRDPGVIPLISTLAIVAVFWLFG